MAIERSFQSLNYQFDLPAHLVAQHPAPHRDQSRLLIFQRSTGQIEHKVFSDIPSYLKPGDVLVLNNTKVIPARLHATRPNGGKAEIFLVREENKQTWLCLLKPGKKISVGSTLLLPNSVPCVIENKEPSGLTRIRFAVNDVRTECFPYGHIPLPPYIKREALAEDVQRYQTVFATKEGAVAAPTAGLHFTEELLQQLGQKGIQVCFVTLHVGPGTFKSLSVEDIREHSVDPEYYEFSAETARVLQQAKKEGRRIIAVGTTATRVLETIAAQTSFQESCGFTNLYIHPPYTFKAVDVLLTNFHLPDSSLILLVAAFLKGHSVRDLYREAIAQEYRFYSYGDAMLIL